MTTTWGTWDTWADLTYGTGLNVGKWDADDIKWGDTTITWGGLSGLVGPDPHGYKRGLTYQLNRLAGTLNANGDPLLSAQGAANVLAGTDDFGLLGALNALAGTVGLGENEVCNRLGGTVNLDPARALSNLEVPS